MLAPKIITKIGRIAFICTLVVAAACDNIGNADQLLTQVKQDVAYAKADSISTSVVALGDGIVNPSGSISAKKGIPLEISAQTLSNSGFVRWEKVVAGDDIVFDSTVSASTKVTFNAKNSGIRAVFDKTPQILFSLPSTGSVVGTNSKIFLYFTKPIDNSSASTISVVLDKLKFDGSTVPLSIDPVIVTSNLISITPTTKLPVSSKIRATISGKVTDANGLVGSQNTIIIFDSGTGETLNPPSNTKATFTSIANASRSVSASNLFAEDSIDPGDLVTTVHLGSYALNGSSPPISTSIYGVETTKSYVENGSVNFDLDPATPQGWIDVAARFGDSTGKISGIEANAWGKLYYDATAPVTSQPIASNSAVDLYGYTGTGYLPQVTYYWVNKISSLSMNFSGLADNSNKKVDGTPEPTDTTESKVTGVVLFNTTNPTTSPPATEPIYPASGGTSTVSWSFGSLVPVTANGNGKSTTITSNFYVLQTQTVDKAGNRSLPSTSYYRLDQTAPLITSTSYDLTVNSLTTSNLKIYSTDTGGSGESLGKRLYQRTGSGLASPDASPFLQSGTAQFGDPVTLNFTPGEGVKHIEVLVADPVGNASASIVSLDYTVDLTPPPMPSFTFAGTTFTGTTIAIPSMSFGDALTGVVKVEISSGTGYGGSSSSTFTVSPGTTSLTNKTCPCPGLSGTGIKTVKMRVTDAAGNVSPEFTATINRTSL